MIAVPPEQAARVLAIGAYERDNFGDLLYSELMRAHLPERITVNFAAPIGSRPSATLLRAVPPAGPLLAQGGYDAIWAVGGEVVSATLEYAYRTAFGESKFADLMKRSRSERAAALREATEGFLYDSPYIPRPSATGCPDAALVLNSIGASGIARVSGSRKVVLEATLREAAFISVRDRRSHETLKSLGIQSRLAPDLAHTLPLIRAIEPAEESYALVQLPDFAVREHGLSTWVTALADSSALASMTVRLFLAGTAPGHDSTSVAVRARDMLADMTGWDVRISHARGVWPRVDEIAAAALWVGGSLHGRVVAASYGVPRVSIRSWKVDEYAATWDAGSPFGVAPATLAEAIQAAVTSAERVDRDRLAHEASASIEDAIALVEGWGMSSARGAQVELLLAQRVEEAAALQAIALEYEDHSSPSADADRLRDDRDRWAAHAAALEDDLDRWRGASGAATKDRDNWRVEARQMREDRDRWRESALRSTADRDNWRDEAQRLREDRDRWRQAVLHAKGRHESGSQEAGASRSE